MEGGRRGYHVNWDFQFCYFFCFYLFFVFGESTTQIICKLNSVKLCLSLCLYVV